MTGRNGERGAVLVAVLMVLALLSLLGAGAMLSANLETQSTGNQKQSRLAAYAAEAAVDYAVSQILDSGRDPGDSTSFLPKTRNYIPDAATHPVGAIPGIVGDIIPDYDLSYIVELLPGQTELVEMSWSTTDNAQPVLNYAQGYMITGIATNRVTNDAESVKETVRILRRPLTQYLAFYEGDMNWRPQVGPTSVGGGRVHASGTIYIAPQNGITFDSADTWGFPSLFAMTTGTEIRRFEEAQEGSTATPAGSGTVAFPNDKLADPDGILADKITAENQATMENFFMLTPVAGGRPLDSSIRIGVDAMHSTGRSAIVPGGFYDLVASGIQAPEQGIDCIRISDNGIYISWWDYPPTVPSVPLDVTSWVRNIESATGRPALVSDFTNDPDSMWSNDALINADGLSASDANPPLVGSIVYSIEEPPPEDHDPATPSYGANMVNKDYPATLGEPDPREDMDVEFTVVDLQRLECWYRDFLIENGYATKNDFGFRKLLVYATRSKGQPPFQAIKLIGSPAGRWRVPDTGKSESNRQNDATALVPTTFVTDLPLYIEGDFSSATTIPAPPAAAVPVSVPGGSPVAILADSITLLGNSWGMNHHPTYTTATPPVTVPTWPAAYSAAFFAGRHNPATGTGPAEGVENLLRLVEDWSGLDLYITGSFNSLWYSERAVGEFDEDPSVFLPPGRYLIGWNRQFGDLRPEEAPPYVPSVFLVERESWQEK